MRWNHYPDLDEEATALARQLNVHPLTIQVIFNRGVRKPEEVQRFLNPDESHLGDPFLLKDMRSAVERIHQALVNRERIHVHGDYDVDGLSSTSVIVLALQKLGADVHYNIVQRSDTEIGLSLTSLTRDHLPHQPKLIITADCGSSNNEAIEAAVAHSVDVIVVDHHQLSDTRPPAVALLNPHQAGCQYEFKDLAAVGVAFHLIRALDQYLQSLNAGWNKLYLHDYLDLVALGTVADVVPILHDNRFFVREGLELICNAKRPGICSLMRHAKLIHKSRNDSEAPRVNTRTIGYRLAPMINAAGRMGDANRCVELLTTDSYRIAVGIGEELVTLNQERQRRERDILKQATELAEQACLNGDEVIALAERDWHPGVLGIVASRLMERFNRPTIIATIDERNIARGSVRSPERVNMLDALSECSELLESWGGHPLAAGLQIHAAKWDAFQKQVNQVVRKGLPEEGRPARQIDVDALVDLHHIDDEFLDQIALLAPFGAGNPEPVLEARGVVAAKPHIANGTVRVRVRQGPTTAQATGYGLSKALHLLIRPIDVVFSPRIRHSADAPMSITIHDIRESLP